MTSKPRRSCSVLASTRYNLADLYPAARRISAPNVTAEGVSGNGCRLAASHISTQKRLLPSLPSFEGGVYMSALIETGQSSGDLAGIRRNPHRHVPRPVRGSWTTGGASHRSLLGKACKQTAPRPTLSLDCASSRTCPANPTILSRNSTVVRHSGGFCFALAAGATSMRPESPAPSADERCETCALLDLWPESLVVGSQLLCFDFPAVRAAQTESTDHHKSETLHHLWHNNKQPSRDRGLAKGSVSRGDLIRGPPTNVTPSLRPSSRSPSAAAQC